MNSVQIVHHGLEYYDWYYIACIKAGYRPDIAELIVELYYPQTVQYHQSKEYYYE